jgi:hypothetical protein
LALAEAILERSKLGGRNAIVSVGPFPLGHDADRIRVQEIIVAVDANDFPPNGMLGRRR